MTVTEKVVSAMAAAIVALIICVAIAFWWSGRVPNRPNGVSASAVFLWAPHVGLPAPRRGTWLDCWKEDQGPDRCRLSQVDGTTEYEGEFVPYGRKPPLQTDQLRINAEKTREQKVWVGGALVPLVYVDNGEILIPADNYEAGARMLERSKASK